MPEAAAVTVPQHNGVYCYYSLYLYPTIHYNVFISERIVYKMEQLLLYADCPESWKFPANWEGICKKVPKAIRRKVIFHTIILIVRGLLFTSGLHLK